METINDSREITIDETVHGGPSSLLVEDGKSGTTGRFPNRITTPAPTSPAPSRRSLAVAVAHLQSYALCKSLININL
jgi:hypothetical protein